MKTIKINDPHLAATLTAYGIKLIETQLTPNILFIFERTIDTQNIIVLYHKQYEYFRDIIDKQKSFNNLLKENENNKFFGIKKVYRESTKKIRGAPRKVNGIWVQ